MKRLIAILTLLPVICWGQGQFPKGQIIVDRITSNALQNKGGENPTRRVTVYLPPDYDNTTNRYPVIYYLHGMTWTDSLHMVNSNFDVLLDKAIVTEKIRPTIVVISDQYTLYRGSWYSNSSLTGNWDDFTSKDLVEYMDKTYRTISTVTGRGIAGHSMGGHGAIKIGMLHPDVFSSVYALSPAVLGLVEEFGFSSGIYKRASEIKTQEELTANREFLANVVVALGRTFSPNLNKPPFYANLPYVVDGTTIKVDDEVLTLWKKNMPLEMIDTYIGHLKQLKALKLDWGRNERNHIPLACKLFSQKLENYGIEHLAEEYLGDHLNKLWTDDGRALNDMLPFFNTHLMFEELKYKGKGQETKKKTK